MANSDEQLDAWLISGVRNKERRANTVHPSSERLVSKDPGNGESALKAVASWLGTRPKLPIVEFANLSRRTITLTFAEPAVLPDPWVTPDNGSREASFIWGITLQHAESLPQSEGYGWQFSGLTGLGTLADHSRALLNTTRWEILGLAGTAQWTRTLMLTQVMNQAAEPWSNDHDIWLVGYGEMGDKLMNFLSSYHPVHHLHSIENIDDIAPNELRSGNATIYVMGANANTVKSFASLKVSGVGLVTDRIVSDKAMFLTEREGKSAAIGPFSTNLEIFPNFSPELIEAMEKSWEANAKLAADQVSQADFERFFKDETQDHVEETEGPVSKEGSLGNPSHSEIDSNEDHDEDISREMFKSENVLGEGSISNDAMPVSKNLEKDEAGEVLLTSEKLGLEQNDEALITDEVEGEEAVAEDLEAVEKVEIIAVGELEDTVEAVKVTAESAEEETETAKASAEESSAREAVAEPASEVAGELISAPVQTHEAAQPFPMLSLLGKIKYTGTTGTLTGRNAEVLALLKLATKPLTPQEISESLWPGDDATGNSARVRRTRLLAKVRDIVGDVAIDTAGEHWNLNKETIATDLDLLASRLNGGTAAAEARILPLLESVGTPLTGASTWADVHRPEIIEQVKDLLAEIVTKSLEEDAFSVAKAAQMARKKLEED